MPMTTTPVPPGKSIDLFCDFFRKQITSIDAGDFSGLTNLCKRLLLCCILDALAKAAFPGEKESGKRFTRLVREYGSWSNSDRVSLTHLRKLLALSEVMQDPRFGAIKKIVDSMPTRSEHQDVALDEDPDFPQIDALWPRENGEPVKVRRPWAESLRHDYLFY